LEIVNSESILKSIVIFPFVASLRLKAADVERLNDVTGLINQIQAGSDVPSPYFTDLQEKIEAALRRSAHTGSIAHFRRALRPQGNAARPVQALAGA